jgi:CRISPR/Cas system-associated protein Cas10 (large subunit of type III CRISPR-Cas system)
MPEVPLCIHCKRAIDQISDQYVVTNKDTAKSSIYWLYAHAQCQDTYGYGEVNEIQSRLDELACDYVNTQNEKSREEYLKLAEQLVETMDKKLSD